MEIVVHLPRPPDPRFTAIEIRAFRGLRNVRLEGLSRVNVIVGRNNAGKTSVLEAVSACCTPLNAAEWLSLTRRRGLGAPRQSTRQLIKWLFPQDQAGSDRLELVYERSGAPGQSWQLTGDLLTEIQIDEGSEAATREVTTFSLGFGLTPGGPAQTTSFILASGETVPTRASPEDVKTVSVSVTSHRAEAFNISMWDALNPADRGRVVELLRRLDPSVKAIELFDPTTQQSHIGVWHEHHQEPVPLNSFGEGFRRALHYALSLVKCRGGGVLLIDEIEIAIHYSAQLDVYRWLVQACADYQVQLFATTHSLEALDALLDATPELPDTTFFRMYDVGHGTKVLRTDEEKMRKLRSEWGREVRG